VRELQNVLQRIIVLGESEDALEGMLVSSPRLQPQERSPGALAASRSNVLIEALADSSGKGGAPDLSLKKIRKRAVNQVERELIGHVLTRTGWNRSKASRILKVSYKTLLQKIEELKIQPPPELA
jgi:DNA-binding NtrC family response regulator